MKTYTVTHISGQELQVEADYVTFGSAHVVFWKDAVDGSEVVWALRADACAEVTQVQDT